MHNALSDDLKDAERILLVKLEEAERIANDPQMVEAYAEFESVKAILLA